MYLEKEIQDFVDRYKPDFVIEYDGGPRELIMVRYQGNAEEVIIPKGINVIGWNGLGTWSEYYGFFKNAKIKKVVLPEGVTFIGERTFANCNNLKIISLPKTLKSIGTEVFAFCEGIESIDLHVEKLSLGRGAFLGCINLKEIIFPNSIDYISRECFKECISLEKIVLPEVWAVEEEAFQYNSNLKSVVFSGTVAKIGKSCFAKNEKIEEVVFLNLNPPPEVHFEIEDTAFFGNANLREIIFPNNLVSIGTCAFAQCISLEKVILPERLKKIGESAFYNCNSLKEIEISGNVKILPRSIFGSCTSLKKIVLNEGLEEIGEGAFSYTALEEINLPKGVKKIGAYAFSNCTKLTAISLPEGLEEIEYGAFEGCNNITKIELPITIKKLSSSAFEFKIERQYIVRGIPFNLSLGYDEDINFLEKGKWIEHIKLPTEDKEIIKQIILGLPEGKLKTDFWDKINIEKLNENIEMFRKLSIPEEKISNLFVNNIELISVRLDAIIENYNYLERQNVINSNDLQKLFFRSFNQSEINNLSGKNIEQQKEILKELLKDYFNRHQQLPPLLNRLASCTNDKERLEVRDALLYINHMELIDFENAKKIEHATKILTRNLFETIIEEDRLAFEKDLENSYKNYIEIDDKYKKYFNAIKSPFYRKLNGINENFFTYFMSELNDKNANSRFAKFFNTLTTIQKWDSYDDPKRRATLLKNEIIGRIIYACLAYEKEKGISVKDIGRVDFIQIMDKMNGTNQTIFTDKTLVNRMLEIDPYSFDALRDDIHNLEYEYCVKAKQSGYLFSDDDINNYLLNLTNVHAKAKLQSYNEFKQYIEYINNEIGIPKIRKEDKEEFLRKTRLIAKQYIYENKNDNLFSLLRLTDLYLRANSGYLAISAKGDIIETTAKEIFDPHSNISEKDRLLYMMYNLNKLAHNITDLNLKVDFINNRMGNKDEINKIESAVKALDELSRFGFNLSIVDGIVSFNTINYPVTEDDYSPLKILIRDGNNDEKLIEKLQDIVSSKYTSTINEDTIKTVRTRLKVLLDLSKEGFLTNENKEKIRNYAEERALFFDVKSIVAEELLNLSIDELGNDICSFTDMTKEEKIAFYHQNGYIIEVQKDKDGATLVCYSKTFRESFSIHLKNMPPKLHDKVFGYLNSDKYEATIANTKLIPPGLTLRTEKFNPRYGKQALNEIISGGFYEKENEYSIALHNYMEYDLYYQIKELRENQESIKKGTCTKKTLEYFEALNVDEWFKDFEDIDKVQYTGQNGKTILTRIKEQSTTPNDNHHLGVKPKDIKNYKYQIGKVLNISQSHHEKRTISTDETTVETLKKLNLDLGTLPTGLKKEDSKPSHKK